MPLWAARSPSYPNSEVLKFGKDVYGSGYVPGAHDPRAMPLYEAASIGSEFSSAKKSGGKK